MITDVLYSANLYIPFCVKHFELSHVMDIETAMYYYYYYYFIVPCGKFESLYLGKAQQP